MKSAYTPQLLLTIYALYTSYMVLGNNTIYRSVCKKHAAFQLIGKRQRLDAPVIATDVAHTSIICSLKCTHDSLCKSINYNVQTKTCEKLLGDRVTAGVSKLATSNSWEYYEPKDIQRFCSRSFNAHRCGPFQKCEEDYTQLEGYKCIDLQNIALGKATANEPNEVNWPSSRAVDGNSETNFDYGHCSHTGNCCSPMPWWRVDFGGTAVVYSMKITNRGDCCGERLSDFNIRVGDSDIGRGEQNALFKQNLSVPQGGTSTFICDPPMHGRYLYVQMNLRTELTLCEVKVFGEMC